MTRKTPTSRSVGYVAALSQELAHDSWVVARNGQHMLCPIEHPVTLAAWQEGNLWGARILSGREQLAFASAIHDTREAAAKAALQAIKG